MSCKMESWSVTGCCGERVMPFTHEKEAAIYFIDIRYWVNKVQW